MNYIFITGVSTGIGYFTLKALIQAGYHVIGTVRKSSDAEKLVHEFNDKCTILTFDVQDIELSNSEINKILPLIEKSGLNCLINNAGIAKPGPMQYLSETDFDQIMDINVKSVRRITNKLLPYLGTDPKYPAGKIINISSVSGLFNAPFNGAYCISKHALESMTDIYRRELSLFGIKVIAIEPGPVKTKIWSKNKGTLDQFNTTPYGELLSSADIMIENAEKSAYEVDVITSTILKVMASSDPKTRYLIHKKSILFRLMAFYLPDKWVDKLITRTLGKKQNFRPV